MVRMRKKEKMRRFSDEQIERLEVMFESYTKLQKLKSEIIKSEEETAAGGTKICASTGDGESDYYTKKKTESQGIGEQAAVLILMISLYIPTLATILIQTIISGGIERFGSTLFYLLLINKLLSVGLILHFHNDQNYADADQTVI
ncbi:hypothetical protein ABFS82_02G178700 [Erythranthe guttata]